MTTRSWLVNASATTIDVLGNDTGGGLTISAKTDGAHGTVAIAGDAQRRPTPPTRTTTAPTRSTTRSLTASTPRERRGHGGRYAVNDPRSSGAIVTVVNE